MDNRSKSFNIGNHRDIYILGDRNTAKIITKSLSSLTFLNHKEAHKINIPENSSGEYFVVTICDFTDRQNIEIVSRALKEITNPNAHKIIYAINPIDIDQQHLLFGIELNVKYTTFGYKIDQDLKEHIKRSVFTENNDTMLKVFELEIIEAQKNNDLEKIRSAYTKVLEFKKDEASLRVMIIAALALRQYNKVIHYLQNILILNPQNLWATNEMMRHHLRANKAIDGIEGLAKYTNFQDSWDKQKSSEKYGSILSILNRDCLSEDVLSFLNLRASLAIKTDCIKKGISLYRHGLGGCRRNLITRSKLYFNLGLAYTRLGDFENAVEAFNQSVELGKGKFIQAVKPLELALRKLSKIKKADSNQVGSSLDEVELDI